MGRVWNYPNLRSYYRFFSVMMYAGLLAVVGGGFLNLETTEKFILCIGGAIFALVARLASLITAYMDTSEFRLKKLLYHSFGEDDAFNALPEAVRSAGKARD